MVPSVGQRTLTITARIKPRARIPGIVASGNDLVLRVRSAPLEGRANAEAIELLADAFGVAKSRVELVAGARSRTKRFRIHGASRVPAGLNR